MHPALSVILFTTLSGTGFGLLFWLGLLNAWSPMELSRGPLLALFGAGLGLVSVGLFASFTHLGKPLRAWRAFSQWRSSWLSREGVAAVLTYVPAVALFVLLWRSDSSMAVRLAGVALAMLAVASVVCTAMIYASLRPIAAWRNRWVVPGYLGLAVLGGGWLMGALLMSNPASGASLTMTAAAFPAAALAALLLSGAMLLLKLAYWRETDATPFASTAERATGLGAFGNVRSFEAPHTEANYLLREMGFVLARRHAARLRRITLLLTFALPPLALAGALLWPAAAWRLLAVAALVFQCGVMVERWLFFAQARHTVALYYGAGDA